MALVDRNQEKLVFFFKELMAFSESNLYCLSLRPKRIDTPKDYFKDDFDFLVKIEELPKLYGFIYDYCKINGIHFQLEQKFRNKRKLIFFSDPDLPEKLTLEFWTAIEITQKNSPKILPAKALFESLENNRLKQEELLPLIYFTHLFHKNKEVTSTENKYRIQVYLDRLKVLPQSEIHNRVEQGLKELKTGLPDLHQLNKTALTLLESVGISPKPNDPLKLGFLFSRIWHKVFYLHHIVPVMGPDGVGKGSVSNEGLDQLPSWKSFRFKDLYRMRIFYKHLVLRFFNTKDQPKNKLDEQLGYYIFFVALGSIRFLRLYLGGGNVLLDRYYPDYFATPIRYPEKGEQPKKLKGYSTLLFLTPVPKKMVFMGCSDKSLTARKDELPLISVQYLQDLSIEFILKKKIPTVLFLSTENPVKETGKVLYTFLKEG